MVCNAQIIDVCYKLAVIIANCFAVKEVSRFEYPQMAVAFVLDSSTKHGGLVQVLLVCLVRDYGSKGSVALVVQFLDCLMMYLVSVCKGCVPQFLFTACPRGHVDGSTRNARECHLHEM